MNRFILVASLVVAAGCTTAGTNASDEPAESAMSQPTRPTKISIDDANTTFLEAYAAGDAGRAAAHYEADAVWYLTNGAPIVGREAIRGFLAKAHADGAGNFVFSDRKTREVGEFRFTEESFAFDFAPGTTVSGTRYGLWSLQTGEPVLVRDAWASDAPATPDLATAIGRRADDLAAAYNGGGADAVNGMYTDDATIVLSNGTVVAGDGLRPMLGKTAAMGIKDMQFGPQTVIAAGEGAAYSVSTFDVTLPMPDGDVPLSGERLLLWRQSADGPWRVALELSWPRAAAPTKTAAVEAGGVKFSWSFRGDRLHGRLEGPNAGWLAVGFNDREDLAGSRLVMAAVTDGVAVVEEHFADPPNHRDIRELGAPPTVLAAQGHRNGSTVVEFELDRNAVGPAQLRLEPGMDVWVTLAYSESDDFTHHSRFRAATPVRM